MKTITKEELARKIELHQKWLRGEEGGEQLILAGYNLSRSDLSHNNLRGSNFRGSDLSYSNINCSDLSQSDLRGSNLKGSNLRRSSLKRSDLSYSNLSGSDLRDSQLSHSNLGCSDLSRSCLNGSDLNGSNLDYSCLSLWCGSLNARFDDRQIIQIVYHAVKAGLDSPNVSEDVKSELRKVAGLANRFHRVDECGRIEAGE